MNKYSYTVSFCTIDGKTHSKVLGSYRKAESFCIETEARSDVIADSVEISDETIVRGDR